MNQQWAWISGYTEAELQALFHCSFVQEHRAGSGPMPLWKKCRVGINTGEQTRWKWCETNVCSIGTPEPVKLICHVNQQDSGSIECLCKIRTIKLLPQEVEEFVDLNMVRDESWSVAGAHPKPKPNQTWNQTGQTSHLSCSPKGKAPCNRDMPLLDRLTRLNCCSQHRVGLWPYLAVREHL